MSICVKCNVINTAVTFKIFLHCFESQGRIDSFFIFLLFIYVDRGAFFNLDYDNCLYNYLDWQMVIFMIPFNLILLY